MKSMMAAPGMVGARQAGVGFGGCMVAFVQLNKVEGFVASVREIYHSTSGTMPDIYPVEAVAGAGLVALPRALWPQPIISPALLLLYRVLMYSLNKRWRAGQCESGTRPVTPLSWT